MAQGQSMPFKLNRMESLGVHVGKQGHLVITLEGDDGPVDDDNADIVYLSPHQVEDVVAAINRLKVAAQEAYNEYVVTQEDGVMRIPGAEEIEIYVTEGNFVAIKQGGGRGMGESPMILVHPAHLGRFCELLGTLGAQALRE